VGVEVALGVEDWKKGEPKAGVAALGCWGWLGHAAEVVDEGAGGGAKNEEEAGAIDALFPKDGA
jgi:hypothetical protein